MRCCNGVNSSSSRLRLTSGTKGWARISQGLRPAGSTAAQLPGLLPVQCDQLLQSGGKPDDIRGGAGVLPDRMTPQSLLTSCRAGRHPGHGVPWGWIGSAELRAGTGEARPVGRWARLACCAGSTPANRLPSGRKSPLFRGTADPGLQELAIEAAVKPLRRINAHVDRWWRTPAAMRVSTHLQQRLPSDRSDHAGLSR